MSICVICLFHTEITYIYIYIYAHIPTFYLAISVSINNSFILFNPIATVS